METDRLEDVMVNAEGRMFVKYTLKKQNMRCSLGSPGSRKDAVFFSCGHGDESSGQLLRKDTFP
jgi:hypothetical protein